MKYIPIIKLKLFEIAHSTYLKGCFSNKNIFPFLELMFDIDKKEDTLNRFLKNANITEYFLGIPHKPAIFENKKQTNYLFDININPENYYKEYRKLSHINNCIPVIYIYSEQEIAFANDLIDFFEHKNKKIGIFTTPNIAAKYATSFRKFDYIFIDLDSNKILSNKPNLIEISKFYSNKNIILIRENRKRETSNVAIELDKHAPLYNDLSTEFATLEKENLNLDIYGFGDYCGAKNDINEKRKMSQNKLYPATVLYMKNNQDSYFLGIKSAKNVENNGFDELLSLVQKRKNQIDPLNKTQTFNILGNEKYRTYAFWNVLSEWHYIYVMSIYDSWSKS